MKLSEKNVRLVGLSSGIAIFAALFLMLNISAKAPSLDTVPAAPQSTQDSAIGDSIAGAAEQLSKAYIAVANQVRPVVVSVYSERLAKSRSEDNSSPNGDDFGFPFFRQAPQRESVPQRGMGSGIILDKEGHILTNNHVVDNVDKIKVQLADKREYEAEIVSTDPKTDVAVIRMKGRVPENLAVARLGNSDSLQVGELVMAVGAPFGLLQTVTEGIISAKGRANVGIADYEDFLQTDAPINPGNSGGPLVNMRGEVIGMNSAIATNQGQFAGIGFAIPSNMIKSMLPSLTRGESITRGMIGVVIQDLTEDLARQFRAPETRGSLVAQVNKNSPAEKAGVRMGDVIVEFDGRTIADTRQLRNYVAATKPGTTSKLKILRDGKEQTLTVEVGKLSQDSDAAAEPSNSKRQLAPLGLSAQTLTPEIASQLGMDEEKGVLITRVQAGSLAATAGLQTGDIVQEVDKQKVTTTGELQDAIEKGKDKESVLLLIKRKGTNLFVSLKTQ